MLMNWPWHHDEDPGILKAYKAYSCTKKRLSQLRRSMSPVWALEEKKHEWEVYGK